MRYKKIKEFVEEVLQASISFIKRSRKRSTMPFKEMREVLAVLFPKTRHVGDGNGLFKPVFTIHFGDN